MEVQWKGGPGDLLDIQGIFMEKTDVVINSELSRYNYTV